MITKHQLNTMGLSPFKNCIRAMCPFAPILQGDNCFRLEYLDITLTFSYIFGDYLNWGNTSCKVNGIFNRLVERKSLILSYEIDFMIIESGLSLQWQKHAGDFVTSDPFYCWEVTKMALDCIRNSCNMIMTSHIQLSVGKGCPTLSIFQFFNIAQNTFDPPPPFILNNW